MCGFVAGLTREPIGAERIEPMSDASGDVRLVVNGELYGYR
jgi:asparagine synthetase B (glutamine-hydrolysing)